MTLNLFSINVTSNKNEVLNKFSSRRFTKQLAAELSPTFANLEVRVTKDLTILGTSAAKSVVPYHKKQGGTLRNQHIENNINRINKSNLNGLVWVDDRKHFPPYKTNPKFTAATLAEILNDGVYFRLSFKEAPSRTKFGVSDGKFSAKFSYSLGGGLGLYKRTRASDAEDGFTSIPAKTPTKGWIGEATRQWNIQARVYFSTDKNVYNYIQQGGSINVDSLIGGGSIPNESILQPPTISDVSLRSILGF